MVAWYWLLVVAFVTFPAGFCLFCLLAIAQVSSDAEAAHEETGPRLSIHGETPIARAAREASEVGMPLAEEIEAARKIARMDGKMPCMSDDQLTCIDPARDLHGNCPLFMAKGCTNQPVAARQWLSSHGIDPDAEIEAAR